MDEVQQVEEDIARYRAEAKSLREQIGDRAGEGPADAAEMSMLISNAEQMESLADQLAERREKLLKEK